MTYIGEGLFGYLDFFRDRTNQNILLNYHVKLAPDPLIVSAFIAITITIVMAFPLNIFPCRYTLDVVLERSFFKEDKCIQSKDYNVPGVDNKNDVGSSRPTKN